MVVNLLVGAHERSIDDKGRLSLPIPFREQLGERCFLSYLPGAKCIGIWTVKEFLATMDKLQKYAEEAEDGQNQLRIFSAGTQEVRQDRGGRIMIPSLHREAADLAKEALVCGAANRVEIWNPKNWEQLAGEVVKNKQTWL